MVENLDMKTAGILLSMAHYFDLHELEILCTELIDLKLTDENVCETFDLIHNGKRVGR